MSTVKKKTTEANGDAKANGSAPENGSSEENSMDGFQSLDKTSKRMPIENMYQRKTQLEHILLRPDAYIGSVEFCDKTPMWVYDSENDKMVNREISYVPGLYKIFDEILVNAADTKQRDKNMNTIRIDINKEKNEISVYNNGKGIPVVKHKTEKMYFPELIFGTLLTSSNNNDDKRKVTRGRIGYGAKLCNIFSKKFVLETSSKAYRHAFKQTWKNNMTKDGDAEITKAEGEDFTKVTFCPDLSKFKMTELDGDIVALMSRRAFDIAGTSKGVAVYLNGKKIPLYGFKQYVELYTKDYLDSNGEPYKVAHEVVNDRWEIAVTVSEKNFQQVSFVNSIATTKGGRHIDYINDQIVANLMKAIKKKIRKQNINVKPFHVKNQCWVFVNCLIENPSFDSQTKEKLTTLAKYFGSTAKVSEKFSTFTLKCGISDAVLSRVRFKQQEQADKKCCLKKTSKLKGIPKLEDANNAATTASKKKIINDGEDDFDVREEDDDVIVLSEDETPPPPPKSKRAATKRRHVNDDEDFDPSENETQKKKNRRIAVSSNECIILN